MSKLCYNGLCPLCTEEER